MDSSPTDLNDYSPSSTIVNFDSPVPLLRGPIAAGLPDDPSAGPFVLAFRNAQSWLSAYRACESQITSQCEGGARIGCAISASSKCKPPWWRAVLGRSTMDFTERAKCEEREMAICVEASKEKCREFAKNKCLSAFRDARIAFSDRKVDWKEASKLIYWASLSSAVLHRSLGFDSIELDQLGSWIESKCVFEVTNCRGSDYLGTNLSIEKCLSKSCGDK